MKHLIIYAHPNKESLNAFFKQAIMQSLQQKGNEVIVRDLYALSFNPVLSPKDITGQMKGIVSPEIQEEQDYIAWADALTFIYPVWWTGMPAIMKGYIDRVLSYGFAYRYDQGVQQGLLTGKSAIVVNTHGKSMEEYRDTGMHEALLRTSDKGIFQYCGLHLKQHFFFGKAEKAGKETITVWVKDVLSVYE